MADVPTALERWHRLSRSDRQAILAKLDDGQRRDLMAMLPAMKREQPEPARQDDGWTLFSPPVARLLAAAESGSAISKLEITPATAALLLETARTIRASQPVAESWLGRWRSRVESWSKAFGL